MAPVELRSRAIPSDPPVTTSETTIIDIQRQARIARAAALAVLAWMFLPLVTGHIYVCDDLLNYHLPIRRFYADCLQQGDRFDWMPSLFNGFFLTGSGQAGTYHPWHWCLYQFLPLPVAFNLEIMSSYPLMLFGMKLFLQRQLQRADAAWLGAIVFTFSGFCLLHFLHPNAIAVVSHIPWLLLVYDVLLRPSQNLSGQATLPAGHAGLRGDASPLGRAAAEAGVALLTGSQLLLGYPQYVWFSLLAEAIFCLSFAARSMSGFRTLSLLVILKTIGLTLGAVQLLPSMDALAESDRGSMPAEYFFQYSLTALDMLQWINPFLTTSRVFGVNTHELGVYCGAFPFLLALVALSGIRSQRQHRQLVRTMIVLGLIALWLSFGRAGGLYVVQSWLPLIGKFRWPSRIVVLLHFVVAVLAAIGYVRLSTVSTSPQAQRGVRLPLAVHLVPCLSIAAILLVYFVYPRSLMAPWSLLVTGPILIGLAYQILRDFSRGVISPILMIFIAGDLAAYGFTYEALSSKKTYSQILAELSPPPGQPAEGKIVAETHLSETNVGFGGNELLLLGWQQTDGYEGLLPKTHLLDEHLSVNGLRVSGVRWIVNAGQHSLIQGLKPTSDPHWLEVPNPLPRVRLTSDVRVIPDINEAVRALNADGPVVVADEMPLLDANTDGAAGSPGTVKILADRPGDIRIDADCDSPRLLVLAERWSAGWKVLVDDVPAQLIRAEVDFMGCVIPRGTHSVRFLFDPPSLANGRTTSVVSLLLLSLYAIARWLTFSTRRPVAQK